MKTRIEKNALGALASAALLMVLTGCGSSVVPIKSSTASTSGAGTTSNTGGGSTYVPIVTPTSTPTPTVTPTVTPTPTASTTPTATTTPATPWANAHIAEGDGHSCLIDTAGGVWCWGHNTSGQLGNNTTTDAKTVVRVSNLGSGVKAIAAGGAHSCALTSTGAVYCWGANESGELGNGTKTNSSIPVAVSGLTSGALAIAVGYQHSCAISRTYALYCWGSNNYGQLGIGSLTDSTTPKAVSGFSTGAIGLALGYHHSCATDVQGALKCWGYNDSGRLGDGTTTNRTVPTQVVGLTSGVVTLAVGYIHTCAVDSVGTLSCWGSNYYGQLGAGTSTSGAYYTPVAITTVSIAVQGVSLGGYHTCITDGNAGLQCWGYNAFGQLGDSTKTNSALPVTTNNINGPIRGLAVGGYHSCALDASGIQCWGNNQYGQLGDGTLTHQSTPVSVYSGHPSAMILW